MNYKNILLTGLLLVSAATQAGTELQTSRPSTPKKLGLAALYAGCSATALIGGILNAQIFHGTTLSYFRLKGANRSTLGLGKIFARTGIGAASSYILAFLSAKKAVQTLKS